MPWAVAHQTLLSIEFSRQEYWSGLPFSSPENLPDPATEPMSPSLQVDSLPSEPPGTPQNFHNDHLNINGDFITEHIFKYFFFVDF